MVISTHSVWLVWLASILIISILSFQSAPQCDIPAGGGGASSDRDSYYGYSDEGEEEGDSNDEGDPGLQYHPRPDKATLRRLIEEVKDRTGKAQS